MSDGVAKPEPREADAATAARNLWARPSLTKLNASDAENFTRVVAHDGQLTFS